MDKIVEAMARALYEADDPWHKAFPWPTMSPDNEGNADAYRRLTRAALAVAAPMVLEMAANAKLPGRLTERTERAEQMIAICSADRLGATISFADEEMARLRAAIRNLKETFNGNG